MAIWMLAAPGALAIGLSLGLLGSGGSILTVPVLVYLLGQPEKIAIAGSLAIVALISAVGSLPYLRSGQVHWRSVLWFGVPGMFGTYAGAWASAFVPGSVQLSAFALVMLLASVLMLMDRDYVADETAEAGDRQLSRIVIDGLVVGVITGFVGVGGGFLVVPALVLMGGLSMHVAVPTSLLIIALKSVTGFVKYLDVLEAENLVLDVDVIALVALIGIVGSFAGNALSSRLPQAHLKKLFGWFLVGMGAFILYQSAPSLF